jgi:hypothetical protein
MSVVMEITNLEYKLLNYAALKNNKNNVFSTEIKE